MSAQQRWLFAILLVLIDLVAVVVPLTAIAAAYVLIARPPWFRQWAAELYDGSPSE